MVGERIMIICCPWGATTSTTIRSVWLIDAQLAAVDSFQHPDARSIRHEWAGEPFDMHACVQALSP
jgi:hypothetical protein